MERLNRKVGNYISMVNDGNDSQGSGVEGKEGSQSTQETNGNSPQTPTVSMEDFVKMQLELAKANKSISTMESDKVEVARQTALASLKAINPKLAEMNKDASESTLNAVRNSVEQMSKGFKSRESNDDAKTKVASEDNHESSYYDFENGKWMYQ